MLQNQQTINSKKGPFKGSFPRWSNDFSSLHQLLLRPDSRRRESRSPEIAAAAGFAGKEEKKRQLLELPVCVAEMWDADAVLARDLPEIAFG